MNELIFKIYFKNYYLFYQVLSIKTKWVKSQHEIIIKLEKQAQQKR
jgi:hypothetical protein